MRTNPRPTRESISFYYPEDYGPFKSTTVNPDIVAPFWKRLINSFLPLNNDCIPSIKPGSMLEIGCASGTFLHHMAKKGWAVTGIEISPIAAKAAQCLGYSVFNGAVEDAPEPANLYDLVVGWMVLEHLHDPLTALGHLRRWTRPGGWLVLSVPNAGSLEFSVFREYWYALDVPRHLYHFTPQTLRNLMTACGWRVEKILHQRIMGNLAASIGYRMREKGYYGRLTEWLITFPENGPMQYVFYPLGLLFGALGQTGRMTVFARNLP
jgi:SAM-dependent methyltransferase